MTTHERELAAYYDQDAADRAVKALDADRIAARDHFLRHVLRGPDVRLLELGTGVGRDSAAFVAAGVRPFGVDLSLEQSRHAARLGARQVVGSVRRLPFTSQAFDAVWTMSVLMHVPNVEIEVVLGELRRVLRPGGVAAIGVWGGDDVEHRRTQDPYRPARLFSRRSNAVWRSLLQTIGPVRAFETWAHGDGWWYQLAYVQRDD